MTTEDVRLQAQIECGMQINDITAYEWTKEAIKKIVNRYPRLGKLTTETIKAEGHKAYDLKEECLQIYQVRFVSGRTPLSPNSMFDVLPDNTIKFKCLGEFEVSYYAMPNLRAGTFVKTSEIPLPSVFQDTLHYYLTYKQRSRSIGETDTETMSSSARWEEAIREANTFFSRRNRVRRRMPPSY